MRLFTPYRAAICAVVVLIAAYSALNAAVPLLTREVFDRALFGPGGPDLPLLALIAGLAAAVACAVGVVDLGQTWLSARVAQRVVHGLRTEMFGRLQRMPLSFFATERGGEIQSRLAGDTAQIEYAVKDTLPGMLSGVTGSVVAAGAMAALSPALAGVALVLAPLVLLVASRSGRALENLSAVSQRARAELSSIVAERLSLGGVTLARVHGRRDDEAARFAAESERLARLGVRAGMVAQWVMSVGHVFFVLTPYLVFVAAGLTDGITRARWPPSPCSRQGSTSPCGRSCTSSPSSAPPWAPSSGSSTTSTSVPSPSPSRSRSLSPSRSPDRVRGGAPPPAPARSPSAGPVSATRARPRRTVPPCTA